MKIIEQYLVQGSEANLKELLFKMEDDTWWVTNEGGGVNIMIFGSVRIKEITEAEALNKIG
jgi:hypothetical protein